VTPRELPYRGGTPPPPAPLPWWGTLGLRRLLGDAPWYRRLLGGRWLWFWARPREYHHIVWVWYGDSPCPLRYPGGCAGDGAPESSMTCLHCEVHAPRPRGNFLTLGQRVLLHLLPKEMLTDWQWYRRHIGGAWTFHPGYGSLLYAVWRPPQWRPATGNERDVLAREDWGDPP